MVSVERDISLAEVFAALAHPTRIALLRLLAAPAPLRDLRPTARQRRAGLPEARPISRQAVQAHLASLEEVGLVRRLPERRPLRAWYAADHDRVVRAALELVRLTAGDPEAVRPPRAGVGGGARTGGARNAVRRAQKL